MEHEKPWEPLSVSEVAQHFAGAPFPWWVAGGIAIELAVETAGSRAPIRHHEDIDVLVLRRDHTQVRNYLRDWDCWVADPPGELRSWPLNESLSPAVHDVWCRRTPQDSWRVQLMIDESESDNWVSRRDSRVRCALDRLSCASQSGIPYLAPHVQLYYKAKNIRPKDQADFDAVVERDVDMDREWLRDAIARSYGTAHPWLPMI